MPRPDGAVLDALDELTTRTRAVARSLLDTGAEGTPSQIPASFGEEYGRLLRMVADAARQLAGQRGHTLPGQELAALSDRQRHVEHQVASLADSVDGHVTAQRLSRLSAEMIREIGVPGSDGRACLGSDGTDGRPCDGPARPGQMADACEILAAGCPWPRTAATPKGCWTC